ncbi:hypothetical protein [Sphingobacterium wenxiniae]|uniref:hypothetical protein n=1 Tax=Sphingobacterium wenxiniae TaxID=683125 RepID=UPI001113E526|nr:hypothetical protein [Sphingobacterium wenxiniae]
MQAAYWKRTRGKGGNNPSNNVVLTIYKQRTRVCGVSMSLLKNVLRRFGYILRTYKTPLTSLGIALRVRKI